jgi:hypothetical protein
MSHGQQATLLQQTQAAALSLQQMQARQLKQQLLRHPRHCRFYRLQPQMLQKQCVCSYQGQSIPCQALHQVAQTHLGSY